MGIRDRRETTWAAVGRTTSNDQTERCEAARVVPGRVLVLVVLLLALLLAGVGFAVHLLWWIAAIVLGSWVVGWALANGEAAGSRRRY